MEFQVAAHQLTAAHTNQQHALLAGLHRDQQPLLGVGGCHAFACSQIEKIQLVRAGIEAFNPLLHAVFMGADIHRSLRIHWTHPVLPGEHGPEIGTQVFIAHRRDVVERELIPAQRCAISREDALKLPVLPGVHDHGRAVLQFPENQAVNRNISEIQPIPAGIKARDICC